MLQRVYPDVFIRRVADVFAVAHDSRRFKLQCQVLDAFIAARSFERFRHRASIRIFLSRSGILNIFVTARDFFFCIWHFFRNFRSGEWFLMFSLQDMVSDIFV